MTEIEIVEHTKKCFVIPVSPKNEEIKMFEKNFRV